MVDEQMFGETDGFWDAMWDLSFTSFITPTVVGISYVFGLLFSFVGGIGTGVVVLKWVQQSGWADWAYVFGPLAGLAAAFVLAVMVRLGAEWAVLFFRIGEFSREQVALLEDIEGVMTDLKERLAAD